VENIEVLKQRLLDADMAKHQLLTGAREVTVIVGGYGETRYSEVNMKALDLYIAQLKNAIAKLEGRPRRGPLYFRF